MNPDGAAMTVAGNMAALVAVMPLGRAGWFFEPSRLTPHNEGTTMTEAQEAAARALADILNPAPPVRELTDVAVMVLRLDVLRLANDGSPSVAGHYRSVVETAAAYLEFIRTGKAPA